MISEAASVVTRTFRRGRKPGRPVFASALALFFMLCPALWAATPAAMSVSLLTRDLGDPRAPGNVKMALSLPADLLAAGASPRAEDFAVYVYPTGMSREEGMTESCRAWGLYLWRDGERIFVDARLTPPQQEEGLATVRVVYAPDGKPIAEGAAEASCRYASELVDVVLAVDVSDSMAYNDPRKRRVTAARTFIDMARKGGGIGRVGLTTFNQFANMDVPLIPLEQGERLLSVLNNVGAGGLTNLDGPLALAEREFAKTGSRRPVVILLTDGKNEGSRYQNTHLECARAGIRIFTVGLTESADHGLLREMAENTGGIYFRAPRDSDLPEIYARLAAELGKRQLLHAERLGARTGDLILPVDATVKRLTVMADAGARIAAAGPGGATLLTGEGAESVHMGRPEPGEWRFSWRNAAPNESVVAFFGDTPFFLDVFPPQLRGGRLAVGATLAQGVRPLGTAKVWVDPLPGVTAKRIDLFDDGRHGDGMAGDGVYGNIVEVSPEGPEHFDLTLRSSGMAWDKGAFVRQAVGPTVREFDPSGTPEEMPEPPPPPRPVTPPLRRDLEPIVASVSGDIDFGVLYPGETGTAEVRIGLKAWEPRELSFDLVWNAAAERWPELVSSVMVEPGERTFELEMRVPDGASPGEYRGEFSISDKAGGRDHSAALVRVGTVELSDPGEVDLGTVAPGTFAARTLDIAYTADKETPLFVDVNADDGLSLNMDTEHLPAGRGTFAVEVSVAAPLDAPEGERFGRLVLEAGPARREIPLRWRIASYVLTVEETEPVSGLLPPPELPATDLAPRLTPPEAAGGTADGGDGADWRPDMFAPAGREAAPAGEESPWERTAEALRSNSGQPEDARALAVSGTPFPVLPESGSAGGDSLWSAWWVYLLAALLLLLLLLLLLAYILYRLGKSSMARFLLVSTLVNLILLIVFIALLGTSMTVPPRREPAIAVRLVEDEAPARVTFTPTEMEMLTASAPSAAEESETAAPGAAAIAAPAVGQGMPMERMIDATVPAPGEAALAMNARQMAASSEARNETPLRRRDRRMERDVPLPPVPDMAEPEAPTAAEPIRNVSSPLVEEARPEIATVETVSATAPSDGMRIAQAARLATPAAFTALSGVETATRDTEPARLESMRGRLRSRQDVPVDFPEPRVEIADPVRDALETTAGVETLRGVPGIEEIRPEPARASVAASGRRAGQPLPPEAAPLLAETRTRSVVGESGNANRPRSALQAASRRVGGAGRRGAATLPEANDAILDAANAAAGAAAAQSGTRGGNAATVEERRFAAAPSGGTGSSAVADGMSASDKPAALAGAKSLAAAPNSLGEGTAATRSAFSSGENAPTLVDNGRLPRGRIDSEQALPATTSVLPGGDGVAKNSGNSPERPSDSVTDRVAGMGKGGRGYVGENRFDDMAAIPGSTSDVTRPGVDVSGLERAELAPSGTARGLPALFPAREETDWRRNARRDMRRAVAAATSSMDAESLVMVVGDFSRLPDPAAGNLFAVLNSRLARGLPVEDRRLAPDDPNLHDCLLAVLSPEETRNWSDADITAVGAYLAGGGHVWMDAARPADAEAFMRRLAAATGGKYAPLDAAHQLSDGEQVDALTIDGKLAAVTTYQDWRAIWRYGNAKNGRTLRFLIRAMNYFLSGDAEVGIELDGSLSREETRVDAFTENIPERLAGNGNAPTGRVWDDFGPDTAGAWRLPAWSDPGVAAAASDGQGGRVLKLDLKAAVKGRAAFYRALTPPQDFSRVGSLSLDVYYDGGGDARLSLTLTVPEGSDWVDYETVPVVLRKGWNSVRFSPRDPGIRRLSRGTGAFPASPDRVGRLGFFLYRGDPAAALVLLRDIRLHDE